MHLCLVQTLRRFYVESDYLPDALVGLVMTHVTRSTQNDSELGVVEL
jgi:hypothetical protein